MEFQVKLTRSAEQQIESIYLWLKERNPDYSDQWFRGGVIKSESSVQERMEESLSQ